MVIIPCKDQGLQDIEGYYQELSRSTNNFIRRKGLTIQSLLERLKAELVIDTVWALTSHDRLCFLAENDWRSPWLVIIDAPSESSFEIEYLVPQESAPWPFAYVKGTANCEDDAVNKLKIAFRQCQGWESHLGI